MARTITKGNTADNVTTFQVQLCTGSGWQEIGSRVSACSLRANRGTGRWTAQVQVINTQNYRDANQSLDPGHASNYNPGDVPLLGAYKAARINIGKGGESAVRMFDGYVGPGRADPFEEVNQMDVFPCDFVGVMQPYFDFWIDKQMESSVWESRWLTTGTNVLNTMLGHYGFANDVIVASNPNFYVHHYEIGDISLGDAIQRPVQSIGFCLEERYNSTNSEYRPTVIDPDRGNTGPDITIGGDIKLLRTTYTEANVRTRVRYAYRDRTTGKEAAVEATDATALAKYGIPDGSSGRLHKYMRVVEEEGGWVDTRAEAVEAVSRCLTDVSTPSVAARADIPWLCLGIELGDIVRVTSHSETVDIGVSEIRHDLGINQEGQRLGRTQIIGTVGQRVGNRLYWYMRGRTDWVGKHDRDRDIQRGIRPDAPTKLTLEPEWDEGDSGRSSPIAFFRWAGVRDWRTKGYHVKWRQAKSKDSGTATAGSTQTLTDNTKSFVPHEFVGYYVRLGGTRSGEDSTRRVIANTATQITFAQALSTAAAIGEAYTILEPTTDWQERKTDQYPFTQLEGPEGVYVIAQVAAVPNSLVK